MLRTTLLLCLLAVSTVGADAKDAPKPGENPAANPDIKVTKVPAGEVSGEVSKLSPTTISIKVMKTVQDGTTNQRMGDRTIQVPKYTKKAIQQTYSLASDVQVKSAKGKPATMKDVKVGDTVLLSIFRVTEQKPLELPDTQVMVMKLIITESAKAGGLTPPVKKK